ncbi:hypothetical protein ACA584_15030 [Lactiplantibacillus plantarum]|uniref:hypothetical protein n=1 Tax=Lactiplantibacillus plantarum TaxID=1590 RepID=UPI003C1AFC95
MIKIFTDFLSKVLMGNSDPQDEARGNANVLNSLILLGVSTMFKGSLSKYSYLATQNAHIISILVNVLIAYTVGYSLIYLVGWLIQAIRINESWGPNCKQMNNHMIESYRRPLKEKLNFITCMCIWLAIAIILLGLNINILHLNLILAVIALIAMITNAITPIKNFFWRKFY